MELNKFCKEACGAGPAEVLDELGPAAEGAADGKEGEADEDAAGGALFIAGIAPPPMIFDMSDPN